MHLTTQLRLLIGLPLAAALSSCATNNQLLRAQEKFRGGDFGGGASTLANSAAHQSVTDKDAVITKLEAGSMALLAGHANAHDLLKSADQAIEAANQRPLIQIGREVGAMVTNLNSLPYVPTPSNQIMGASYLALSFAEQGLLTEARSAIKLAKNRQQDAFAKYHKEIERERSAIDQVRQASKVPFMLDQSKISDVSSTIEADLTPYAPYAAQSVPYAELIAGLVLGAGPNAELGRAQESLRRALAAAPGNIALSNAAGGAISGLVHVLWEEGVAPSVGQLPIHLPLRINGNLVMFSAAYPRLVFHDHVSNPSIQASGVSHSAELVCDFDRIATDEFRRRLPGIISRTTAASVLKATMAYATQEAIRRENSNAALVAGIVGAAYNISSAQADRRAWSTLPKRVRYAHFAIPSDRSIAIAGETVRLPEGGTIVVRVRDVAGRRAFQVFAL